MMRCTILVVLLIGLVYGAANETTSTSTVGGIPSSTTTTTPGVMAVNQTKSEAGKGHAYEGGHQYRGKHEDHDYYHRDEIISPFPDVKSYFDTHYCSVHGSFALSFNEKVEDQSYDNKNGGSYGSSYQGGQDYGNNGGYGQPNPGAYGAGSGGYGAPPNPGYNSGSPNGYGAPPTGGYGNPESGYDKSYGYGEKKESTKFVRKVTRQYCRYTASWSDKACKFCCRVVARSAYTNPDDITAAIFSFNPASPASGGAGVEIPKSYKSSPAPSYGAPPQPSYGQEPSGYGNQGGYAAPQPAYGGQVPAYSSPPPPNYQPPPVYGSAQPQYRAKRSEGYPAPNPIQYVESESYKSPPSTYTAQPYDDSKFVNQCVCCAPKHRYY